MGFLAKPSQIKRFSTNLAEADCGTAVVKQIASECGGRYPTRQNPLLSFGVENDNDQFVIGGYGCASECL
jgi:hypothetical protein